MLNSSSPFTEILFLAFCHFPLAPHQLWHRREDLSIILLKTAHRLAKEAQSWVSISLLQALHKHAVKY